MTELVPADQIEGIVGATRHPTQHLARAISAEQTVYILHSKQCLEGRADLRECEFSLAQDRGINLNDWRGMEDRAVYPLVLGQRLVPLKGDGAEQWMREWIENPW